MWKEWVGWGIFVIEQKGASHGSLSTLSFNAASKLSQGQSTSTRRFLFIFGCEFLLLCENVFGF